MCHGAHHFAQRRLATQKTCVEHARSSNGLTMNKRPYEGPPMGEHGHVNKKREVESSSAVEKIDEELANMSTSQDANVQVRGCVNLWQMAADPNTHKALASTSAIQLILTTINTNCNHIGVVTVALNTLYCILASDRNSSSVIAANNKLIVSCDGINSILDITRKHINNEFVCKRGCELLNMFANDPEIKKNISCIIEMMHTHSGDGEVQFAAFGILAAFSPSEYTKEEITAIIVTVLESLHECHDDVAVQWKGLVLLHKLTKNEHVGSLLLQRGGVATIMKALRNHQLTDVICERGFQILQHLSEAGRPFARDITLHGGLSIIVGALKCHNEIGTIQLYGCRLLYTILHWGFHTPMKGGIETILSAMRTFTYDVEIQEYACGILSILSKQDDYRTLIMINHGVDLLLQAMKTHLVSVGVNVAVCKTLSHLYMILEVCRERQVIEMIDCILLTMRVHQQNSTIQNYACSLLELLADNARYKHEIILRGGRACVKTAIFTVDFNGKPLLKKLSRKDTKLITPPDDKFHESHESMGSSFSSSNNHSAYNNNNNNTYYSIPDLYDTDDITSPGNDGSFVDTAISNFNTFGDSHFTTKNSASQRTNSTFIPLPNTLPSEINTHKQNTYNSLPSQTTTSTTTTNSSTNIYANDDNPSYGMDVDFT